MHFFTLLLPFLGLAAAAPGYPTSAAPAYTTTSTPAYATPCYPAMTTVTSTKTTYTSTSTTTKTVSATSTATTTTTLTATSTTTTTTTSSVLGTSIVSTCVAPSPSAKRAKRDTFSSWSATTSSKSTTTAVSTKPTTTSTCPSTTYTMTTTTTLSLVSTVTQTTTTTGTVTITSSTTTTTTTTATATTTTTTSTTTIASIPTFVVFVQGGDNAGNYFSVEDDSPAQIIDYTDLSSSASFSILAGGSLAVAVAPNPDDDGKIAAEDSDYDSGDPNLVYVEGPNDVANNGPNAESITCSIGVNPDGTCPLNCVSSAGDTVSYDCGAYWRLAPSVASGCYGFNPFVVGPV